MGDGSFPSFSMGRPSISSRTISSPCFGAISDFYSFLAPASLEPLPCPHTACCYRLASHADFPVYLTSPQTLQPPNQPRSPCGFFLCVCDPPPSEPQGTGAWACATARRCAWRGALTTQGRPASTSAASTNSSRKQPGASLLLWDGM